MTFVYKCPPHLGGHEYKTNLDTGAFDVILSQYVCRSFIDIGCGPGGQVAYALTKLQYNDIDDVLGIDGDYTLQFDPELAKHIRIHDFTSGAFVTDRFWDLGWSVEFVEHVEEQYAPNFLSLFARCRILVMTHAVPGQGGWHHVNCRNAAYWIRRLADYGFMLDMPLTESVRRASTMQDPFMRSTGMVFLNTKLELPARRND